MAKAEGWTTQNPSGRRRVIVTKELPGARWLEVLIQADCHVTMCTSAAILSSDEIKAAIGDRCDAAIGQLTEPWDAELLAVLGAAGGKAYSNYAVGYNNVDLAAATRTQIPVGNTPGVLTETTAEMAVALTFAAARRVVEADSFMRRGAFKGWQPNLFLGKLLHGKTLGIIGAGRIGSAYAQMMVEGHKMNIIYYSPHRNEALENRVAAYSAFLASRGEEPLWCKYTDKLEEILARADAVSLHASLNDSTRHIINADRLAMMKEDAILVNSGRGPLIDESALVAHCKAHPEFRAALDVFEDEPEMKPGLAELQNVVIVPHIGSATRWTREAMATLAAFNVAGILCGYPVWNKPDIRPFLGENPPQAAPSILNADELGLDACPDTPLR